MTSQDLDAFAAWVEDLMRERGYDIDSPRGGGKSRIADEAGVHRAAVTRLLQRQSMPDLETTRRLARVLGVPVREMLIRSGRLTAEELADPHDRPAPAPGAESAGRPTLEEVAELLGIPADRREMFVRVVEQFLPQESEPAAREPGHEGTRRAAKAAAGD
ncbi:helix-turn-helix domain-containing protein [Streptomyces murinus]|uniref:Transcriptional regulator with XRE-family HTH domain n=1 Tax=Streptomyces murinus TaxID=33900 RepID=A0A7W3NRB6_STRMR|nr:helix-turn-helix transcriptional regulator [Streptomyces murinus]MBA9055361.1 transcriptional regulator with XRE-family HTH domain [Streptomyces murinus]UWW89953.1 helix-turn-helix domain-containing protein [Streptomyces murinus]